MEQSGTGNQLKRFVPKALRRPRKHNEDVAGRLVLSAFVVVGSIYLAYWLGGRWAAVVVPLLWLVVLLVVFAHVFEDDRRS